MKQYSYPIVASIVLILAALVSSVSAQRPSPTSSPSATRSPFQLPDMGAMYSQMMNAMFSEYIKPERAAQLAHFQKLYYDALMKEGFTSEQALEIIKAAPVPAGGMK